ncbi:2-dehydropantoate 2-reductase [Diutina catenulata]
MPIKIHVLGAGAMGQLMAHELYQALGNRVDPVLILKNPQTLGAYVRNYRSSVTVSSADASGQRYTSTSPLRAVTGRRLVDGPIENLVISTKSHVTSAALRPYVDSITPATNILMFQNGMGVMERLVHNYWPDRTQRPTFYQAITTHGACKQDPFTVAHLGNGAITMAKTDFGMLGIDKSKPASDTVSGAANPESRESMPPFIEAILESDTLNAKVVPYPQFLVAQLEKLVINACINPLTAVFDCRNGDLLLGDKIANIIQQTVVESARILQAAYPSLMSIPEAQMMLHPTRLASTVREVCEVTRENSSSMREDMRHLRKTEIDFINGFLFSLAKKHRQPGHVNRMLLHMVEGKLQMAVALERNAVRTITQG